MELHLHVSFISALDVGEWSPSLSDCSIPGENKPLFLLNEKVTGPQGLATKMNRKKKNTALAGNLTPILLPFGSHSGHSTVQLWHKWSNVSQMVFRETPASREVEKRVYKKNQLQYKNKNKIYKQSECEDRFEN
jgi:hypothetical protein